MWRLDAKQKFGFLSTLSEQFWRAQSRGTATFPELRHYPTLIVGSDYSGYHPGALYRGLSFLIAGGASVGIWFQGLEDIRRRSRLGKRRLSFKALRDQVRLRAFDRFIASADSLDGVLVTFVVGNTVESLFREGRLRGSSINQHALLQAYTLQAAERLLEVTHLLALLIAGLSGPGQSVLWLTDHDDIVPNQDRLTDLVEVFVRVSSHILPHGLEHLRVGTPSAEQEGLEVEDLLALPDLAAGSLCELLENLFPSRIPAASLSFPRLEATTHKAQKVLDWLSYSRGPLKKLVLVIDEEPESGNLRSSHLQLHGSANL